ncbi:MAG: NUDIX hydrolase [Candidatus Levybacteria bacterium]|nr:NUDIX hydrolase [Candidatus Levybacteria bacterium]MBP9815038.1 NUDIX hydrolase [Candidatus Levybacteria bacterium]
MIHNTRISTVAALAFKDDKVLLVRHGEAAHHLTGVYGLPGGRLDEGENLLDGAAREFQEETGLIADKSSMVQIPISYEAEIPRKGGEILSTSWSVFLVKNYQGDLLDSKDTDETIPEWVEVGSVAELNLLPNTEDAIKEGQQILNL